MLIVFEIITFAITFLGVLSAGYAYERSRNYIDLAVLILFVSIFTIDIIMTLEANFLSSPVLFGQATLTQVMLVVMATTFSWFVFYFKKWDSGYSVPFILGLFVILILRRIAGQVPHLVSWHYGLAFACEFIWFVTGVLGCLIPVKISFELVVRVFSGAAVTGGSFILTLYAVGNHTYKISKQNFVSSILGFVSIHPITIVLMSVVIGFSLKAHGMEASRICIFSVIGTLSIFQGGLVGYRIWQVVVFRSMICYVLLYEIEMGRILTVYSGEINDPLPPYLPLLLGNLHGTSILAEEETPYGCLRVITFRKGVVHISSSQTMPIAAVLVARRENRMISRRLGAAIKKFDAKLVPGEKTGDRFARVVVNRFIFSPIHEHKVM